MRWQAGGAEVTGAAHRAAGTPCQDAADAWVGPTAAFGAVADGLGSCARSGDGARAAVAACREHLPSLFADFEPTAAGAEERFRALLDRVRTAVRAAAAAADRPADEFLCNLVAVVAGETWTAAAAVGDGFAAVRLRGEAEHALALPPEVSRYANETATVLDADADLRVYFAPQPAACAFASSDGLTRLALSWREGAWAAHQPFFREVLERRLAAPAAAGAVRDLLDHPQVNNDRTDDDKSLVALFRLPEAP